jgi:sugar lactone lactonase YvrE
LLALICFLALPGTSTAEGGKLRWIQSIYVDSQGRGIKYPEGVACKGQDLYVADTGNSRVLHYTYADESVSAVATFPLPKSSPMILQVNSKGEVHFLDGRDRQITILDATGAKQGSLKPKGVPSSAEVIPRSFRIDGNDNIYILDVFSGRVVVVEADGKYLREIPVPKGAGFFSDLAVDSKGNVLLLDSVNAVVYSAAAGAKQFSQLSESLEEFVNFPTSLTTDSAGKIYLVDQHGSGLALLAPDGSFMGHKLGKGWNESRLYYPSQLCISDEGTLFIADRNNSRVQLFSIGAN